jgi:hypothetical protein
MVTFLPALPADHPKRPEWMDLSWVSADHPHRQKLFDESAKIAATTEALVRGTLPIAGTNPLLRSRCVPAGRILRSEVVSLKDAIYAGVPRTDKNAGLYDHLELTAGFAGAIATVLALKEACTPHPPISEAGGFTHDIGKLAGVSRYHLHDLVGERMLLDMGVRGEVRNAHQPAQFNVGPLRLSTYNRMTDGSRARKIGRYARAVSDALTLQQKIGIVADVSGKRSKVDKGQVWTWEEMSAFHLGTRKSPEAYAAHIGENAIWPAEFYAMEHIPDWALGWMDIYNRSKAELEARGADVDEIRKKVQDTVPLPTS